MSNCLSNDEATMDPAITDGFGFVSAFRDVLTHDHLAAVVRNGSIANGILRILGDESRSVVRRGGGGNGG